MKLNRVKIVADGRKRYQEACNYDAVRRRLYDEAEHRYAGLRKSASVWGRIRIAIAIHREVAAEMEKLFPSSSLHVLPTQLIESGSRRR